MAKKLEELSYKALGQVATQMGIKWIGKKRTALILAIRAKEQVPIEVNNQTLLPPEEAPEEYNSAEAWTEAQSREQSLQAIAGGEPIGNTMSSKKAVIIAMLKEGTSKAEIARQLNTHYSYVHTVEKQLEQQGFHYSSPRAKTSKAQQIRDLADRGYTRAEICKQLDVGYSQVYGVLHNYIPKVAGKVE